MKKLELLAPCGNFSKLKTALRFGADAVYVGGKSFSLRSFADNFTDEELIKAVKYTHALGKKLYVTVNIFASNADFIALESYLVFLSEAGVDAAIVSDPGIGAFAKKVAPKLNLHISTQANTLNKYAAAFWAEQGAKRIILARELSLDEIKEIRDFLPPDVEIEAFCHGAMCISYSGRCLLSNYFTGRNSNRGECVQACRWNYTLRARGNETDDYPIEEDERGTYILNSKDLNMIDHIDEMANCGVCSFKIEGRMKSEYYLATVVNAYRRAFDAYYKLGADYKRDRSFYGEVLKTNHRAFTTAYTLGENDRTVNYDDTQSAGERTYVALVLSYDEVKKEALVEMHNRFFEGDELEVLTPNDYLNAKITVGKMTDENGEKVTDAKLVMQRLLIKTDQKLCEGDILRK